jgi:hypothetical protein
LEHPVDEGSDLIGATGADLVDTMKARNFITIGVLDKQDQFTFISKFKGEIAPGDRVVGAGDISQEA